MPIRYLGLKDLEDSEKIKVKTLTKRYLEKLTRDFKNSLLKVHIKKEEKGGKRHRYTIISNLEAPTIKLTSEVMDWDLSIALHKTFKKLEIEATKVSSKLKL